MKHNLVSYALLAVSFMFTPYGAQRVMPILLLQPFSLGRILLKIQPTVN